MATILKRVKRCHPLKNLAEILCPKFYVLNFNIINHSSRSLSRSHIYTNKICSVITKYEAIARSFNHLGYQVTLRFCHEIKFLVIEVGIWSFVLQILFSAKLCRHFRTNSTYTNRGCGAKAGASADDATCGWEARSQHPSSSLPGCYETAQG